MPLNEMVLFIVPTCSNCFLFPYKIRKTLPFIPFQSICLGPTYFQLFIQIEHAKKFTELCSSSVKWRSKFSMVKLLVLQLYSSTFSADLFIIIHLVGCYSEQEHSKTTIYGTIPNTILCNSPLLGWSIFDDYLVFS